MNKSGIESEYYFTRIKDDGRIPSDQKIYRHPKAEQNVKTKTVRRSTGRGNIYRRVSPAVLGSIYKGARKIVC